MWTVARYLVSFCQPPSPKQTKTVACRRPVLRVEAWLHLNVTLLIIHRYQALPTLGSWLHQLHCGPALTCLLFQHSSEIFKDKGVTKREVKSEK